MKELMSKLSSLSREMNLVAGEQTVLSSLCYKAIRERQEKIADAHEQTFQWVFDPSSSDLIRTVCASKLKSFQPFVRDIEPWTRPELWEAISQLKKQSETKTRFCFFVDGLDEYDGEPDLIIEVLESLRSWPEIKLCISSRPWNEFCDAFGRASDPQQALEELTRDDIKLYVKDTLEENLRFQKLKARDGRSQDLVLQIVEKARGVFLWVSLVVKSLLTGLKNADRMSDLQKRLDEFPTTLEDFFRHMLDSVDGIYRSQTAEAFTFALEAVEPLSLMTFSFLDEEDPELAMTSSVKPLSEKDIIDRLDDMRRRLNARCKGLLEVSKDVQLRTGTQTSFTLPKVDFLHRTARDFLLTKSMQSMLEENLEANFDPRIRLCKALLCQMKTLDYRSSYSCSGVLESLLDDFCYYARQVENDIGLSQTALLDEVENVICKRAALLSWKKAKIGFLGSLV
ncbi:MAG: hypothetical protein Q9160_004013 [Pyrenula sp. 1 TL-2023]